MIDPFVDLEDEPRWVAWREELRNGKRTKIPYSPSTGSLASATDPRTWARRIDAEGHAKELLNGEDKGGVGVVLGDVGNDLSLCGADLDSSRDENGALARWAVAVVSLLRTYTEVSPSGHGLKAFFYIPAELVRRFLDLIGVTSNAWGCKRGIPGLAGADHGPGIEIYTASRYFTTTGRLWSIDDQRIVTLDWPQLEALAALIPPASASGGTWHSGNNSGRDNSGSGRAWRAALAAAAAFNASSFEEMCEGLRNHADPAIRDWFARSDKRQFERVWGRGAADIAARLAEEEAAFEAQHPAPGEPPAEAEPPPGPPQAVMSLLDAGYAETMPAEFSDEQLALTFTAEHHQDWRYVALWAKWLQWVVTHWRLEDTLRAFDLVRVICRAASAFAEKPSLARSVASARTVAGVERLARADRRHATTAERWDDNHDAFHTPTEE